MPGGGGSAINARQLKTYANELKLAVGMLINQQVPVGKPPKKHKEPKIPKYKKTPLFKSSVTDKLLRRLR
jgi:hypothetical protein